MYQLSSTLEGHSQDVRDVAAISDDRIASVSRDGTLRVWSKQGDGRSWQSVIAHQSDGFLNSVCYSKSNSLLFYGGKDSLINGSPVDAIQGEDPVYTLIGHNSNVCSLDCLGGLVISGSWDKTAIVWENGTMKWQLRGHEASVWDAKILPGRTDEFLTASADMTVRLWKQDRLVKTFTGLHKDVIRHLEILPSGDRFATCSNDGTIKICDFDGKVLQTLEGHESFVYSFKMCSNGELVSCGEDRTVRIWLRNGQLKQVIQLPAISVWTIDVLPNDDIAVGSSDNSIRVFTENELRRAPPKEIDALQKEIESSTINSQTMGVDESKIEPYESLLVPGKKEGQVVVVRAPTGVVEAHQFTQGVWSKIGDVVGSAQSGSGKKTEFEGKKYDYVFDVDIEDGKPPLKLPVNTNDNPYTLADEFLARNDLPISYRDQVVNFILKNTSGVSLDQPNTSRQVSNFSVLPVKEFLFMSEYNPETIFNGIVKLNSNQKTFDDESLAEIGAALHNADESWELLYSYATTIRSQWQVKVPAYDLMRIIVAKLPYSRDIGDFIEEGLGNKNPAIAMLTARILTNCFQNENWGIGLMSSENVYSSVFVTIDDEFPQATEKQIQNFAIAVSTLLFNYSALVVKESKYHGIVPAISDAINTKFGIKTSFQNCEEAAYRLLIAFGNLATVEPSLKHFAGSLSWTKKLKLMYGSSPRFQHVFRDLNI
ncbi:hypothetical protein HG536_0G04790 [Torulaspora globosa]|uniref:Protein DOA1 n=1 Tax=Torulaspora globosa TaxID=48254 RepID=A0A7G3ZM81_9SACH|nr:uncharacterized protein HG536_0G04790 [Torulaspora globosa]QLL34617.1 hypothetical protein HG536_0G04790 [Torulaspora globosa]